MLGNYLKFNDNTFPNPIQAKENSKTLENVSNSEAGTDLVVVIRNSKKTWDFSFDLSKGKRDVLENICKEEATTMSYKGQSYTVRVRDFSSQLVEGSEWLLSADGLYKCSVKVTEY